ncbi:YqeG family HAD IIIA-type phosphatase [Anaerorhabdus sp.]|uniref:YqeG family HAD IIIA-type phosphatase n=1 Tax=Anaerorhabdus sp. TaxID=1872524 RepID=UPI002FCC3AE9
MIDNYFLPTMYIRNYQDLDLDSLVKKGIKVFVIDVDNTLISHEVSDLDSKAIAFIHEIQNHGMIPVIISNNVKKRVEEVARQGSCDYFSFALKPLKYKYKQLLKRYNCTPNEVITLGDQLITDVLGGNRMKFNTILQDPISKKDNTSGKVTRFIETKVFKHLEKQGKWRRNKYYDCM